MTDHKVYLVGAGPGDPDLLTIKAVRALEESDVVLYDELVNEEILSYCQEETQIIFVGKHKGNHSLKQDEINQLLLQMAKENRIVSRLKGGDPFIFGRGGEEYEFLSAHGVECQIIPGITAASGASAYTGLPLTHRDYASRIAFHTGHSRWGFEDIDFSNLSFNRQTHVIYMGLTRLEVIMQKIISSNPEAEQIPVAIVEKATRHDQRIFTGTISNIHKVIQDETVTSPALIVIGSVVNFLNKIRTMKQDFLKVVF